MSKVPSPGEVVEGFPTPENFCLTVSSYKPVSVTEASLEEAKKLLRFNGHLDMYCPQCGETSVFRCATDCNYQFPDIDNWYSQGFLRISAYCSRVNEH